MIEFQLRKEDIDFIKGLEGCKLKAYQDSKGVWTIGVGHTEGVKKGMVITKAQAEQFLANDLRYFVKQVNRIGVAKNNNQFASLVSFAFNVGIANLLSSTLLKKIKLNRPTDEIQAEFMRWVYVTIGNGETKIKRKVEGLVNRRAKEAELWARK